VNRKTPADSRAFRPLAHFLAAALCTALESVPVLDRYLQSHFFRDGSWLVSGSFHESRGFIFYTGPKILIAVTGAALLAVFVLSWIPGPAKARLLKWRRPSIAAALGIACVPLAVSVLKELSGVYCPADLVPYGGLRPHAGFLGELLNSGSLAGGRCFPAGHASGGFALVALRFVPAGAGCRTTLLALGLLIGWGMGLYQMARGQHFATHTLTSMFLALGITALMARSAPGNGAGQGT
jgi:membrane-associated PAP2 superfamily phosphatase